MIMLSEIWNLENHKDYKVHFARISPDKEKPLEVWLRSEAEWEGWQKYMPSRNDFNRPKIFALMDYYHEPDVWLFGGIYNVKARHSDNYDVELSKLGANFIGRLKIRCSYKKRLTRPRLESVIDNFEVAEILSERYTGRAFPGLDNINIHFEELETIIAKDRHDWRGALKNLKGIYLITDSSDGRVYVGSAYGEHGIWSRWVNYINTGDGGNIELRNVVKDKGIEHCRKNFRFALLEAKLNSTADDVIIARENYWKELFQSRGSLGMNRN